MITITTALLDELSYKARGCERLRVAFDLRDSENDTSQKMLNALEPGTRIPIHRHRDNSETIIVLRGSCIHYVYDDDGVVIDRKRLAAGSDSFGISVNSGVWHTLEPLESGTVVMEAKDGKYIPLGPEDILEKSQALSGSAPRKTVYLCLAHMSEEGWEQKYVKEAFDTNWVVPMGPNVNAFEKSLTNFVNISSDGNVLDRKVVCLSAGTAAVHLALLACGVGPDDEVCVQSFTFCASSHPITYLGAKPVFIGSEKDTWNMDPELLEEAIVDRYAKTGRYPKAIVPVALYGMPYRADRILTIGRKYGIPVVEDAAEGLGSRYDGQVLGTFGKFGVLSFNGNKMITTSGGGALICNDSYFYNEPSIVDSKLFDDFSHVSELSGANPQRVITSAESAQTIMWYATQARDAYPYYQHSAIGYNYRMSNVCAGIGRGQMKVLDKHIAHHKHVHSLYEELLADVPGIRVHKQPFEPQAADPTKNRFDANYWLCAATLDQSVRIKGQENAYKEVIKTAVGGAAGVIHAVDSATTDCQPNENVEALRVWMLDKKVECRPVWKPMHKQPVYAGTDVYTNGVEEEIFKVGFCLPAGPCVTDDDVRYIVECIKEGIE